jgi:hypothetical protein
MLRVKYDRKFASLCGRAGSAARLFVLLLILAAAPQLAALSQWPCVVCFLEADAAAQMIHPANQGR